MNGWFLTLIIIDVLNIGVSLAKHGEKNNSNYNFFTTTIGVAIQLILIYMAIKTGF